MTAIILISICIVLVMLPPKHDPAIRLKEWTQRRKNRP
jgi:hypothetical protein